MYDVFVGKELTEKLCFLERHDDGTTSFLSLFENAKESVRPIGNSAIRRSCLSAARAASGSVHRGPTQLIVLTKKKKKKKKRKKWSA